MAKKQGSQLYNRQMCFFTGETLEQKPGAEIGEQADSRKETLNKACLSAGVGAASPGTQKTGGPSMKPTVGDPDRARLYFTSLLFCPLSLFQD